MPNTKPRKKPDLPIIFIGILALIIISLYIFKALNPSPVKAPLPSPSSAAPILNGIYKGKLPCADCPGIEETLILAGTEAASGTYVLEDLYKEKSVKPFLTNGTWEKINSNILKIIPQDQKSPPSYFQIMDNNTLEMLDSNMQKIDSPFNQTLTKQN